VTARRRVLCEVVAVKRGDSLIGFPMAAAREIRHIRAVPLPHATPISRDCSNCAARSPACSIFSLFRRPQALPDNGEVMAVLVNHRGEPTGQDGCARRPGRCLPTSATNRASRGP